MCEIKNEDEISGTACSPDSQGHNFNADLLNQRITKEKEKNKLIAKFTNCGNYIKEYLVRNKTFKMVLP